MEQSSRALERIGKLGLIVGGRGESRAAAIEVATALIEGGVEATEISFTTPEAHRVMEDLLQEGAPT